MVTQKQIVDAAREYLGTPFQHQGRLKGVALDCVGLPLCVGQDLGLTDKNGKPFNRLDDKNYGPQPMGEKVLQKTRERLIEIALTEIQDGDVLLFRNPTHPVHAAIKTPIGIIHAYSGASAKTVEHVLDDKWRKRLVAAFRFPGVQLG